MRLWTVQSADAAANLRVRGTLAPRWPAEPGWAAAARWMAEQMVLRGTAPSLAPPLWAWHSCGARGRAPDDDTLTWLTSEAERDRGLELIEFVAPSRVALLSLYRPWNRLLDGFLEAPGYRPNAADRRGLFNLSRLPRRPWGERSRWDVQATLPYLEAAWVRRSGPWPRDRAAGRGR